MWHIGPSKSLPKKKEFTSSSRIVGCVCLLEMGKTMSCFGPVKNSVQKVEQFQQKLLASFARQPSKHQVEVHSCSPHCPVGTWLDCKMQYSCFKSAQPSSLL